MSASAPSSLRRPGRPPVCSSDTRDRAIELREAGLSYAEISKRLQAEGLPTPGGGAWTKAHVYNLLHTRHVEERRSQLTRAGGRTEG
ncbi:recombinase family protein [Actinomadura sp. NPDC047616]|uniref:recombinase family protein n=1 Tax=Actinomadura sp. NPDC047616 TaxID=3155914 RepID=UPI0033CF30C1